MMESLLRMGSKGAFKRSPKPVPYAYRAAPEGRLNVPKANRSRPKPVWKRATVYHYPMWSRVCQSQLYDATMSIQDTSLNANPTRAPLVCNVSHSGVRCKEYQKGTTSGSLSTTQERLNARKVKHPGTAWHGTVRFAFHKSS